MPSSVVKSYAEKSGKTVEAVETLWNEIKAYVNKKYPKLAKKRKFMYIVSVLGKKLGIKKTKKVKESTATLSLVCLLNEAIQGKVSNCCGAGPENDQGLCPECKEYCEFIDDVEDCADIIETDNKEPNLALTTVVTLETEIYNEDADNADVFVKSIIQDGIKYSLKIIESKETPLQGGGVVFSITGTIKNIIDWNKSVNTFEEVEEIFQQLDIEKNDVSNNKLSEIVDYFNKSKE